MFNPQTALITATVVSLCVVPLTAQASSSSPIPIDRAQTPPDLLAMPDKQALRQELEAQKELQQSRRAEESGYAWGFGIAAFLQIGLGVTRSVLIANEICSNPKGYVERDTPGGFAYNGCAPRGTNAVFLSGTAVKLASFTLAGFYGATRYSAFQKKKKYRRLRATGVALTTVGILGWFAGRIALSLILAQTQFHCPLADMRCIRTRWAGSIAGIEAAQLMVTTGIALIGFGSGEFPSTEKRGVRLALHPSFGGRSFGLSLRGEF